MSSYKKYNIKVLEQCFIGAFLLKSRFGSSDIMVPMGFWGDCSHYADLPKPEDIFDYEKYTSPNYLLDKDSQMVEKELDNINNSDFNFVL